MSEGKLVDVAIALMRAIDDVDGNGSAEASYLRERLTASTMRRAGCSDEKIVGELGYLPEPFRSSAAEVEREVASVSSPGMR